jgi:hypothetical protein
VLDAHCSPLFGALESHLKPVASQAPRWHRCLPPNVVLPLRAARALWGVAIIFALPFTLDLSLFSTLHSTKDMYFDAALGIIEIAAPEKFRGWTMPDLSTLAVKMPWTLNGGHGTWQTLTSSCVKPHHYRLLH